MRPDIDAPFEPPDGVVHDGRTQMTPRLQRISCLRARGSSSCARALGDRIRSVIHVCHWSEGEIACCGYLWWESDTETSGGEAFARRLERNGWETVGRTQEGSQRPSERVTN